MQIDALPIMNNPSLSDREYKLFADLIYDRAGINLGDNKKDLVKARLMKRLRFFKLNTFKEYYDLVLNDQSNNELIELIDAISTNVTSFFREKSHFELLDKKIIPEILNKKRLKRDNKIRIWCAASSTGEEPYTIMMTVLEHIGLTAEWDVKLLATDISTKVLKLAQDGVYPKNKMKGLSPDLIKKYFMKLEDPENNYQVIQAMREKIFFRRFNLMTTRFPFKGMFDFVFCRNVMIYFDRPTQENLVKKIAQFIVPGGYLFIGHSESLAGFVKTGLENVDTAVFRKVV